MENEIKRNIENPEQLEKLYLKDKIRFEEAFFYLYPEISNYEIVNFWKIRLEYSKPKEAKANIKNDIMFLIISSFIIGFLIKIPDLFNVNLEIFHFYEKNAGLLVMFGLTIYSIFTKMYLNKKGIVTTLGLFLFSAIYVNLLPSNRMSDTINLAYIFLPFLLWCIYGLVFINFDINQKLKRIDYIKYNGDLAILVAIIFITGGILTAVTIGLFNAIEIDISKFYTEYIVVVGMVSAPIVATYIIKRYPFVTNKIAPIIAHIFTPIVVVTLLIYMFSILFVDKDPYNDREFLFVFNMMLIGVMAIILFSISETSINKKQKFNEVMLLILTIITVVIDLVALSAIIYRLNEYGLTPNRIVVLVSNLLFFGNLVIIMYDLFRVNFMKQDIKLVELTIANYLPLYAIWTVIVVFGFPILFNWA